EQSRKPLFTIRVRSRNLSTGSVALLVSSRSGLSRTNDPGPMPASQEAGWTSALPGPGPAASCAVALAPHLHDRAGRVLLVVQQVCEDPADQEDQAEHADDRGARREIHGCPLSGQQEPRQSREECHRPPDRATAE